MYTIIYNNNVLKKIPGPVIVGDEVEGHIIWQVDYYYKVAWATD